MVSDKENIFIFDQIPDGKKSSVDKLPEKIHTDDKIFLFMM